MNKVWFNILLFLLFILEGTVFQFLTTDYLGLNISMVPRFVLVFIILISIYVNRRYGLFLGLIFGLLYDIVYGNILGVYMVGMIGIGYFSGWIINFFHPTFSIYLFTQFLGHLAFELYLYGMLRLYQLVNIPFSWSLTHIIMPTIIINILFAVAIYPMTKFLLVSNGLKE